MEKIAVFPGSFDPFTVGHEEIVHRGLKLFDRIIIAVGVNPIKPDFLNAEQRLKFINKAFPDNPNVKVVPYSGLTVDFCREQGASIIIRGLRTAADFEYERSVGQANRAIDANIETVFVLTSPAHTFISSTTVRNIFMNGGNVDKFLAEKCTTEDLKACVENSKK